MEGKGGEGMDLVHHARTAGRLSQILREELGVSAGLMNRLKWKDLILVNGQPRHTDYPVQPGDEVRLLLDERSPEYPAEEMDLSILYEDENLLAVDKPPGMLIHPSRHRDSGTLANGVVLRITKDKRFKRKERLILLHPLSPCLQQHLSKQHKTPA